MATEEAGAAGGAVASEAAEEVRVPHVHVQTLGQSKLRLASKHAPRRHLWLVVVLPCVEIRQAFALLL